MYYIGIDLGTSAVKLLLVDETGRIHHMVSKEYPLEFPAPGWSQQDPADWIRAVREGIIELLQDADKSQVRGIGCAGQMHGLVVLDAQDQVIRPAILWNDSRTQKQVEYLNQQVGTEFLVEHTGNIAFAGFTAPKLLWMREEEPELFSLIAKIMLPKDYINFWLTGVHATDVSDAAGTLLLDVKTRRWSQPMLDLCGIRLGQMPKLYEGFEPIGTLQPARAQELGLSPDVIVAAGAGDNAAAAIGCGAVGSGHANISLGTSGTVFITSDHFIDSEEKIHVQNYSEVSGDSFVSDRTDLKLQGTSDSTIDREEPPQFIMETTNRNALGGKKKGDAGTVAGYKPGYALHQFAHADGAWHLMGCILSAASCNKWWLEDILQTEDYPGEQGSISPDKLGKNTVYFLPYLMGERSPHNDPEARGAFLGLRMDHERGDLTQAVMEGVAFAIRDCVEIARAGGLDIPASTLCGGGAKSTIWRTILANVLNMKLQIPMTEQGPGFGGAMLAAVAAGAYPDIKTCADALTGIQTEIEPDAALVAAYDQKYRIWKQFYPALKPVLLCDNKERNT